jgi:hypothetical protein
MNNSSNVAEYEPDNDVVQHDDEHALLAHIPTKLHPIKPSDNDTTAAAKMPVMVDVSTNPLAKGRRWCQ